jgi:hypothetical protein
MNTQFITRALGATRLALKANAPTLMVAGGVVSMGAAVVTASKQTLKAEEVLAKHTPGLEKIQKASELGVASYTEDVARGDRFKVYSAAGFDLCKLYAVPGVLFVGGAALVFGGHRIMLKRNATLAIAFTSVQNAFARYRQNVRKSMEEGAEFDQAMLTGYKKKEIVDPTGVTDEKQIVNTRDWDETSSDPYNRVFEQGESSQWTPDLLSNKHLIRMQQKFAQELLNRRGYLYLSEVYQALGFDESPVSRVVGWKVTRLPDGSKDIPIVDFGLDKPYHDDWKYTPEAAIYLDFNCQGLIVGGMIQKLLERA